MSNANPFVVWEPEFTYAEGPSEWDFIRLQGVPSPGIIKGSVDFERKNKWDKKAGKGTIGATATYVGTEGATGKITFVMWTLAQRVAWTKFAAMLLPTGVVRTHKRLDALDIYHPSLVPLGIKSILVPADVVGTLRHVGKGRYEVTVELTEFIPPPVGGSIVSTPKKSASDVEETPAQKAATAYQKELAGALGDFNAQSTRLARRAFGQAQKP
jgi:hypothetical protein